MYQDIQVSAMVDYEGTEEDAEKSNSFGSSGHARVENAFKLQGGVYQDIQVGATVGLAEKSTWIFDFSGAF